MRRDIFCFCAIAAAVAVYATPALAHPGGLDKNGGHTDKKTGEYHYHKAKGSGAETSDPPAPPATTKGPRPSPAPSAPTSPPSPVLTTPVAPPPQVVSAETSSQTAVTNQAVDCTQLIARLIDPTQLATLQARAADPRIYQVAALLEQARRQGQSVSVVATNAVKLAGYTNAAWAVMTCDSLVRNHQTAQELGVLAAPGLVEMQRGQPPTIANGAFGGDALSVAHTIPFAVAAELDNVIANLELLPAKVKSAKGDQVGPRQYELARKFHAAGLLATERMNELLAK